MSTVSTDPQSPLGLFPEQPKPRLYDCVVEGLRTRHYRRRTEQVYIHWIRLGRKDIQATMVYTHVLNRGGRGVRSPLDGLRKTASSERVGIIRTGRSA